jgi:hypothetical protein
VKLRTVRIDKWFECHKLKYNDDFSKNENVAATWEKNPNECTQLRVSDRTKNKLIVSFCANDGTILVQGTWFSKGQHKDYINFVHNMDETHVTNSPVSDITTESSHDDAQGVSEGTSPLDDNIILVKHVAQREAVQTHPVDIRVSGHGCSLDRATFEDTMLIIFFLIAVHTASTMHSIGYPYI